MYVWGTYYFSFLTVVLVKKYFAFILCIKLCLDDSCLVDFDINIVIRDINLLLINSKFIISVVYIEHSGWS